MKPTLIFDFDDLLVNSAPLHGEATRRTFAAYGVDCRLTPAFARTLYGRRLAEATAMIFEHLRVDSIDMSEFLQRRAVHFLALVRTSLEPMPGFAALISLVRTLDWPRALASSGDPDYLQAGLQRIGLADFFPVIVTGADVTRGKPDPAVFLLAAQRLGADPARCIVLEDATVGLAAAKAAGMGAIGVRNAHAPLPQDLTPADAIVDDLSQITETLLRSVVGHEYL